MRYIGVICCIVVTSFSIILAYIKGIITERINTVQALQRRHRDVIKKSKKIRERISGIKDIREEMYKFTRRPYDESTDNN